jgi:hypothetical protein
MSTPADNQESLHELELNVRAELAWAATSQASEETTDLPIDQWLSNPTDDQRLRSQPPLPAGCRRGQEGDSGPSGESPRPLMARVRGLAP